MRVKRPAILRDVAERAGVSAMTVSLALRGGDGAQRMSLDTRERILEITKELKYSPNARARALRLGRTNVIGLYAGHGYVNVRTPFFTEIVSGLQEGCEQIRKDLLLHGTFHGASSEDIFLELIDGRIDGLIVTMPPTDPLAERLARSGFATIAIADYLPDIPAVVVDDAEGSRLTVEHLCEMGHRRISYVMSPAKPNSAVRRRDAFLRVAAQLGAEVRVDQLGLSDDLRPFVQEALAHGVTAAACWNDDVAYSVFRACRELGVKVPNQLAITGFDGCPTSYGEPHTITTVVAPWAQAARTASLFLDALLRGQAVAPETVLPVRLARGITT